MVKIQKKKKQHRGLLFVIHNVDECEDIMFSPYLLIL